jgi:hypothetical protein
VTTHDPSIGIFFFGLIPLAIGNSRSPSRPFACWPFDYASPFSITPFSGGQLFLIFLSSSSVKSLFLIPGSQGRQPPSVIFPLCSQHSSLCLISDRESRRISTSPPRLANTQASTPDPDIAFCNTTDGDCNSHFHPRSAHSSEPAAKLGSSAWLWLAGAAAVGGGGWFFLNNQGPATPKVFTPKFEDYQAVYNEIANRLEENDEYDDGSYGPVLLRLAWHASGTYDKETGTGGSNGATMRFAPESDHGANAGLKAARDFLEPVKRKYCSVQPRSEKLSDG